MFSINSNNNRCNLIGQHTLNNHFNSKILPSFTLCLTVNVNILQCNSMNIMASHQEVSRLVTHMNITTGSGRPSRNSQGICNTLLQPTMPTTPLPETPLNPATVPSMPTASPLARSVLPDNTSHAVTDTSNPNSPVLTSSQDRQVEVLMPCMRQQDRFVDPKGKPLQPGTVIFCEDLPFIVSNNDKIYNYMSGNMKQLYIANPSKHKFLVKEANSPTTFSNILESVLGLLLGFCRRQNNILPNTKDVEDQEHITPKASTIDTISTVDSGKNPEMSNHVDSATEDNAFLSNVHNTSELADFYVNTSTQHDMHNSGLFPTKTVFPNHTCNEILSHYNNILIGFSAPELSAHYGIPLEPQQVSAEEVPNFVNVYLNRPTTNSTEHSSRGRPRVTNITDTLDSPHQY